VDSSCGEELDDLLESLGVGPYQWTVTLTCALANAVDAIEVTYLITSKTPQPRHGSCFVARALTERFAGDESGLRAARNGRGGSRLGERSGLERRLCGHAGRRSRLRTDRRSGWSTTGAPRNDDTELSFHDGIRSILELRGNGRPQISHWLRCRRLCGSRLCTSSRSCSRSLARYLCCCRCHRMDGPVQPIHARGLPPHL